MNRLILLFVLAATTAFANDGTVSLSPASVALRGEAGQSTTRTLTFRNGTSRALTFDVVAQDVIIRDGQRSFVQAGSIPGSIAATAIFSEKRVTVASGESVRVDVMLTVPPNAGSRAVVVLFRGVDKIMNGNMTTTASLGTLLTFALSDRVEMTTMPLAVQPQTATSNLTVTQTCTNSGSEPLIAKGVVAVIDSDGRLAGKAPLPSRRLLPGERIELGTQYSADLAPGRYRVLVTYDIEGRAMTQSAEVDIQ